MNITKEQYKSALMAEGVLKDRSIELLTMLHDAPNCEATAPQLAEMLGYNNFPPINALLGKLGKRIAAHLSIDLPAREGNSPGWWRIVAHGDPKDDGFTWRLREELFNALVELGLLQDNDALVFPEVVPPNVSLREGTKKQIIVNAYERNTVARIICIRHWGAKCAICNFDFSEKYGDLGKGFIHVHHLIELSSIGEEYKVDPINDLRPVCPNCHAMLHQKRPAYTIEELNQVIQESP